MNEGPFRDLGAGFARLTGSETGRRAPSKISRSEDVLLELLENARDAGAQNIYVASTLHARRYRSLSVLDDGHGVPESYAALVFDPGVTSRHLAPGARAGLALHHIKNLALQADLVHCSRPTSFKVLLDTKALPERSLQSSSTTSSPTNLLATTRTFAADSGLTLYHNSPASILARLLVDCIIRRGEAKEVRMRALGVGIGVSERTVRRVLSGLVAAAEPLGGRGGGVAASRRKLTSGGRQKVGGAVAVLGEKEKKEIEAILGRAVGASYLELGSVEFGSRPGEISIKARVYEPEDEYD